jgi:hypothetical protein
MRVGVYVDGFNLYFGARDHCGQGSAGWRWLDVRSLVADVLPTSWTENGAIVERVVYCTARVSGIDDPTSPRDQNVYLRALRMIGSVDHVEFGNFVRRVKSAPVATRTEKGKPQLVRDAVDAAVVVSNDSDLELPLRHAREHVHVGLVNPGIKPLAGRLRGDAAEGMGDHWWEKLTAAAYVAHQLPDPVGRLAKPHGW